MITKALRCQHSLLSQVLGVPNFEAVHSWRVALIDPDIAVATDETGAKHRGSWTMVYSEGFEVRVRGKVFFAFSQFQNGQPRECCCDHTWPGWHRENPDNATWGCYTGSKLSADISEEDMAVLSGGERRSLRQPPAQPALEHSPPPDEAPSDAVYDTDKLVAAINREAGSWRATIYPHFERMTPTEFQRATGFRRTQPVRRSQQQHRRQERQERQEQRPESEWERRTIAALPRQLDWRNYSGQNFIDPVIHQTCGDCYATAAVSMLNCRLRIATNNSYDAQPFGQRGDATHDQVRDCDRYNQGIPSPTRINTALDTGLSRRSRWQFAA